MLLGALCYVPLRRSDSIRLAKPAAQTWHSRVGAFGTTLAVLHSQATLREWSALVLLAITGLLTTGLYGQVMAPLRVGSAFGRSAIPYATAAPDATSNATSNATRDLIQAKRIPLKTFTAGTQEGEFVLRWHHWVQHPPAALGYYRLTVAERRLLVRHPLSGSTQISVWGRLWRRFHLWLAALFIVGILAM